jgi:molecular chaperone DnaK
VTPLTLAIETLGGIATPIIERNTTIPVERTKTFTTAEDGQTQVDIHITQGERKFSADNKSLGRFQLTGIPPAPRGVPQIDVTFSIDVDGILHVTAKDKATGKSASIVIKEQSRLSDEEIRRMQEDAKHYEEEDRRRAEEVETRNRADQMVYATEKALREHGEKVSATTRNRIQRAADVLREKLKSQAPIAEIRQAMQELEEASLELGREIYQASGAQATGAPSSEQPQSSDGKSEKYIDAEYEKKEDK